MAATSKPLHPLGAVGLILLAAGCTAWPWTGEWRWALTGVALFLVCVVLGAVLDRRNHVG